MKYMRLIFLLLAVVMLSTGCALLSWQDQDRVFLAVPFTETGDSRELEIAPVVKDAFGEVLLPFVLVEGGGEYHLTIDDEEFGDISLNENALIRVSAAHFDKEEPVRLFLWEKGSEGEKTLKRLIQARLVSGFASGMESKQDPLTASENFLKYSYSANSTLLPTDLLSEHAAGFADTLRWRQEILQHRRTALGNEKELVSIEPLATVIKESHDLAFVYYKSREVYIYLDEPQIPAESHFRYFLLLNKEGEEWKVLWATRQGVNEVDAPSARVSAFRIPFLNRGEEIISSINANSYDREGLIQTLAGYSYHDLSRVFAWEKQNLELEMTLMPGGLPEAPEDVEPLDREEMLRYAQQYALDRSDAWGDFSYYGGNCQNFASQVLFTGGAPMLTSGEHVWYYHSMASRTETWGYVDSMMEMLDENEGRGLVGVQVDSPEDLEAGDLVYLDWDNNGNVEHVVVVTIPGASPRIAGNTEDTYNKRLSDYGGVKYYYHLQGIRP